MIALGMMVYNEAHWLKLHLPIMLAAVDGVVAVDSASTDGTPELLESMGVQVFQHDFNCNWGEHFNHVIRHAEALGYDTLLRLDPDECMFETDIRLVSDLLGLHHLLRLPRFHFWEDRKHYVPQKFPDWQSRAWRLNEGVYLAGQYDERVVMPSEWREGEYSAEYDMRQILNVAACSIYHYGDLMNPAVRYHQPNRNRLPDSVTHIWRYAVPFKREQPLDPAVIGPRAPFEEA
jgi:glycosyltransferase involved in cell wall biosynthesis